MRGRSQDVLLQFGCGVEQPGSSSGSSADTKLKADIAESAVATALLERDFRVLKPVGDRLPYDLAVDHRGTLIRIQVKHAWFDVKKRMFLVDSRRTKTNRRTMVRQPYSAADFDFAIIYLGEPRVFYVMPVDVFVTYTSSVCMVESQKRQRRPRSAEYRERWDLLSAWAPCSETGKCTSVKFGEAFTGNTEPSRSRKVAGRCRD